MSQMADIYSCARIVEVWLGPCFDDSEELVDLIAREGRVARAQHLVSNSGVDIKSLLAMAASIFQFIYIPYWSRLWVKQEMVLGKNLKIRINRTVLEWEAFVKGWKILGHASRHLGLFDTQLGRNLYFFLSKLYHINEYRRRLSYRDW